MIPSGMTDTADQLPGALASAHPPPPPAECAARREAEALAARARAVNAYTDTLSARLATAGSA